MSYYHQQKPRDCKGNIRQIEGVGDRIMTSWVWRLTYPTVSHRFKFVLSFWSHSGLISCCVSSWCLFPIPLFEASRIKVHWQQWLSTWSSSKFFIGGENSLRFTSQDKKEGFLSLVLFWKNSQWIWTVDLNRSSLVNWTRHTHKFELPGVCAHFALSLSFRYTTIYYPKP
jgi:hypothetical protein